MHPCCKFESFDKNSVDTVSVRSDSSAFKRQWPYGKNSKHTLFDSTSITIPTKTINGWLRTFPDRRYKICQCYT